MKLSDYIQKVLKECNSREVVFDLRLNHLVKVDDNGLHKIKFKLVKKDEKEY